MRCSHVVRSPPIGDDLGPPPLDFDSQSNDSRIGQHQYTGLILRRQCIASVSTILLSPRVLRFELSEAKKP